MIIMYVIAKLLKLCRAVSSMQILGLVDSNLPAGVVKVAIKSQPCYTTVVDSYSQLVYHQSQMQTHTVLYHPDVLRLLTDHSMWVFHTISSVRQDKYQNG
jgi:hypothetical protein